MPLLSIIQNNTRAPIKGVITNGNKEKKITRPLIFECIAFTARAMSNPRITTKGVTKKVKVIVNPIAL